MGEEEERKGEKEKLKHEKRKATRREGIGESEWIDILPPVEKKTRKRISTEQLTRPHNMGPDG